MSYERDQRKFLSFCKSVIPAYEWIKQQAIKAKNEAMKNCKDETKKQNAGSYAGNQVFLRELKRLGKEDYKA